MKPSKLLKLVKSELGEFTERLGFEYYVEGFRRQLDTSILQMFRFGMDHYDKSFFWVLCALDSTAVSPDAQGKTWLYGEYLKPNLTWDRNHTQWNCADEETARQSLRFLRTAIQPVIVPWMEAHSTATQLADCIRSPARGLWLATLYLYDRNFKKVKEALFLHRKELMARPAWVTTERFASELAENEALMLKAESLEGQSP
ncbi:MAG TPA: hypothetical protein VFE24_15000 [Pirellulales bacterium]|jgi:hypothetical protein|nr:hypothetical protein [Pirellulales bacterium]